MTFHSIVRKWCRIYKPMLDSDTNGNRRFYLTDSTAGVVEFAKGIANSMSPSVVMESGVEGYIKGGLVYRNYPVYFFVRARDMADGDAAAEAKEEAWMHCQNFITWLRDKQEIDSPNGDYSRIDLENNIDIQTVGPIENGWLAVLVQFERLEQMELCVDDNLYTDSNTKNCMRCAYMEEEYHPDRGLINRCSLGDRQQVGDWFYCPNWEKRIKK